MHKKFYIILKTTISFFKKYSKLDFYFLIYKFVLVIFVSYLLSYLQLLLSDKHELSITKHTFFDKENVLS